jgi:hypothetical protein
MQNRWRMTDGQSELRQNVSGLFIMLPSFRTISMQPLNISSSSFVVGKSLGYLKNALLQGKGQPVNSQITK